MRIHRQTFLIILSNCLYRSNCIHEPHVKVDFINIRILELIVDESLNREISLMHTVKSMKVKFNIPNQYCPSYPDRSSGITNQWSGYQTTLHLESAMILYLLVESMYSESRPHAPL